MSLTASPLSAYKHYQREAEKGELQGTTDWEKEIDRQIHRLKMYFICYISFQSGVLQDFYESRSFGEHSLRSHKLKNASYLPTRVRRLLWHFRCSYLKGHVTI